MIFSTTCKSCKTRVGFGKAICLNCQSSLQVGPVRQLCDEVEDSHIYCSSAFVMCDTVREIVASYKYRKSRRLCSWMATQMFDAAEIVAAHAACAITWVPATPQSVSKRGYDQGQFLARALSPILNVPAISLMKRCNSDANQTGLSRDQRSSGPRLSCANAQLGSVIVVDDVVTTGSSLLSAARVLRQAGAKKVSGLTFAAVPGNRDVVIA